MKPRNSFQSAKRILTALILLLLNTTLQAQDSLETAARKKYDQLKNVEIDFKTFFRIDREESIRYNQLKKNPALAYRVNAASGQTACGNGDFESGLDPNEWTGAYGSVPSGGTLNFSSLITGITSGVITGPASHQTIVATGTDPNVPVQTTAPGSVKSVRIGNSASGYGAELLSKTFTVTATKTDFRFWYAVVLQDPGSSHAMSQKPFFWVRVVDNSNNTVINNVCSIPNNGKIVADATNPFFQTRNAAGNIIVYRDWECARIDLQQYIGKSVTIQFITQDCTQGAHYGYAYIDNYCGNCAGANNGDIQFSASSSKCGPGRICVDYSLQKIGTTTGTLKIDLTLKQNGVVLQTLSSPILSGAQNGQYCFTINPASIPGINNSLNGFDYSATGLFSINGVNETRIIGSQTGVVTGMNNDYQISCSPPTGGCCPGTNLVVNGDFETAQPAGFNSSYQLQPQILPNSVLPGQYAVVNSVSVNSICQYWALPGRTGACTNITGKFLAVNGKTTQPAGTKGLVWQQTINLPQKGSYRLCFNTYSFTACCFNVNPALSVTVQDGAGTTLSTTAVNGQQTSCGTLHSYYFTASQGGNVTLKILLNEDTPGDGNDFALDNFSLQAIPPTNINYAAFTHQTNNINLTSNTFSVTATSSAPAGYGTWWGICEVDNNNNPIGPEVQNPAAWWFSTTDFRGYNPVANPGSPYTTSSTVPCVLAIGKRYRIRHGVWSACTDWVETRYSFQYDLGQRRMIVTEMKDFKSEMPKNLRSGN